MLKGIIHFLMPGRTLRTRIFTSLLLFTALPFLIIALISPVYINNKIITDYNNDIISSLNICANSINDKIDQYINKSSYITMNNYLIKNLKRNFNNDLEQIVLFMDMTNTIIGESFDLGFKRPYIIYTYNDSLYEGKFVEKFDSNTDNELIKRAVNSPPAAIVWDPNPIVKDKESYITFYRNIIEYKDSLGVLEVNIPYRILMKDIEGINIPEEGFIYLTNAEGDIINLNRLLGRKDENKVITEGAYLFSSNKLKNGYSISVAIPKSQLSKILLSTYIYTLGLYILYVILMRLVSKATSRRITKSLEYFIDGIDDTNLILSQDQIVIDKSDEVSIIKLRFKELISRINDVYKEMLDIKLENSVLEIELLQSQINPHLLYNSLSVIKWNALRNKDNATVDLITALISYYRTALNKGNSIIEIGSELEMIRQYVKISEYAHSAKYKLVVEVEDRVMDCYTIKHLLQPIVENAILHGLNGMGEGALISIKGSMTNHDIIFEVQDNGRGFSQEDAEKVMNMKYISTYGGYGIKNTIKRISAYYGESYGVNIESGLGQGTKVTVKIEALSENDLLKRMQLHAHTKGVS